ncbi:MAG: glycosyltransferase family 9 protein [Omnitrophica bacterium]|nr:glycosyltransferase family 9 protein [Candidatus Omnitrophota bacterium]
MESLSKCKNKKFLIINPFGIGDVLFSTPLTRNIKETFPESKIFYLCNRRVEPALRGNPLLNGVFVYERDEFEEVKKQSKILWLKKLWNLISEVKKEKIDIAIDLSLNSQFGFFAKLAAIKERVGYNYKNRGRFLTKKIKLESYENKHIIEYYLELAKLLGFESKHKEMELFVSKSQTDKAVEFLKRNGVGPDDLLIAVSPCGGASWGADSYRKHWPRKKFAQVSDMLINKHKAKIILTASNNERAAIEEIEGLMHHKPIKAVGLALMDYAALLGQSKILIANDGGPVHIAVSLGIKTVSIFGPVDELVYGPYPQDIKKHFVIKKDLSCRPCYKNFRLSACSYSMKCLETISVDEVVEAVSILGNI